MTSSAESTSSASGAITVGVFERSSAKYGNLAYIHSLLEAGHMAQNVLLISQALGLRSRPIAGFDDDAVLKLLDIETSTERPVYAIAISKS